MKLILANKIIWEREREGERGGFRKFNVLKSGSLVAIPKSGPDYFYYEMTYIFNFIYPVRRFPLPSKMCWSTPEGTHSSGL
jgi:hypothetical protein